MSKENPIREIMKFQSDRGLDKKAYAHHNEIKNVLEELGEAQGYDIPKEHRSTVLDPIAVFIKVRLNNNPLVKCKHATKEATVDAFADIIVFCIGAIMKLGYNPEKVLVETAKEINSREGEMIDGKFEKFLDTASTDKWYKADYTTCKKDKS